jgi:hypothetical protein
MTNELDSHAFQARCLRAIDLPVAGVTRVEATGQMAECG